MKKDNNVVYLHTYKPTYMKKNLRLIIAIILSGSCFISFFTQCTGASKQQSPVVQTSIEKNKADTTQTEIKENDNIDEDAGTTHPAERTFIDKTTSEDGIVRKCATLRNFCGKNCPKTTHIIKLKLTASGC